MKHDHFRVRTQEFLQRIEKTRKNLNNIARMTKEAASLTSNKDDEPMKRVFEIAKQVTCMLRIMMKRHYWVVMPFSLSPNVVQYLSKGVYKVRIDLELESELSKQPNFVFNYDPDKY